MRMATLATLHSDMLIKGIDIQKFPFKTGAAAFECLFSARGKPFELSLTSRGENPKFFIFEVSATYDVLPYFHGDKLSEFISVLRTHGMSGKGFRPSELFSALNLAIPTAAKSSMVPSSEEVAKLRLDLEKHHCPYFETWVYWEKKEGPTPENLQKTRLVLGCEAADYSLRMTASSKWSPTTTGRSWKEEARR